MIDYFWLYIHALCFVLAPIEAAPLALIPSRNSALNSRDIYVKQAH